MAKDVIMPALGMAQETGVLLQWLKAEGEQVSQGEPLMEIETDKATIEVEAPASGILADVSARPGDEIPVGQTIALILAPDETAPDPISQTSAASSAATIAIQTATSPSTLRQEGDEVLASPLAARIAAEHNLDLKLVKPGGGRIQKRDVLAYLARQQGDSIPPANGRVRASPKARRLAGERNLDLAAIQGSGPAGAILAADVIAAAEVLAAAPTAQTVVPRPASVPQAQTVPTSRMWQIMARRLTESWNTVPHFYLERDVNASQLLAWWERAKLRVSEKVTLTDLLVKLVATALRKHLRLNAAWQNENIVLTHEVNVGLAVAVEEGLLVPVIRQADRLGLSALADSRRDIVGRARSGQASLADLQGGTFTISNLGMFGIDAFSAIVNPPQAAILAVGRIADRVVPVEGQPSVQPMMTLTLSCDHRVVDGARGAQFLQTLVSFIEDPLAVLD